MKKKKKNQEKCPKHEMEYNKELETKRNPIHAKDSLSLHLKYNRRHSPTNHCNILFTVEMSAGFSSFSTLLNVYRNEANRCYFYNLFIQTQVMTSLYHLVAGSWQTANQFLPTLNTVVVNRVLYPE